MPEHNKKTGHGAPEPEMVEVVFETTPAFNLGNPNHLDPLMDDIRAALTTDFQKTLGSQGILRITGSKKNSVPRRPGCSGRTRAKSCRQASWSTNPGCSNGAANGSRLLAATSRNGPCRHAHHTELT